MKRVGLLAAMVAGTLLLGAAAAQAAPVSSGSIGSGRLCSNSTCTSPTLTLQTGSSGAVTGSFSIDVAALTLEFDLTLASAVLTGTDGPVTSLALQNVRYQGTATLSSVIANIWSVTTGSASITGTAIPNDGSGSIAIAASGVGVAGGCSRSPTSGITLCGPIFNPVNFTLTLNGETRHMTHTLNVSAPEPAAFSLLGLGLLGLVALRARRSI
jgi:hypothetical protein